MPALLPTDHAAQITWLGRVPHQDDGIRSEPLQEIDIDWSGASDEYHRGRTRLSCVRVKDQHPEGTEIANTRQFSVVSAEELAAIAAEIGLDALKPEWMGASIVVEGIDDFTHIPPSSRLQTESGTTLVIDMVNRPCHWPGNEIEKDHPGLGKLFKRAAHHRRGVTAWVERPGALRVGESMRLHVPDQRPWMHYATCVTGKAT